MAGTEPGGDAPRRGGFLRGLAVGLVVGGVLALAVGGLTSLLDEEPTLPDEAREIIEDKYFRDVDAATLEGSSVRGMVDELRKRYDDEFSHYFGPKQLQELNAATSGEFSGVGLTVTEVKRGLRVASVLENTPAQDAGIERGDLVVAVDGKGIAGTPADVASARIKGPPGTKVELRVEPVDGAEPRDVVLQRAEVRVPAVDGEIVRTPTSEGPRKVAYVRFATFSEGAHGELRETIERLFREGAEGLLLDLRGNGGGLLNEAVLSAGTFVEDGVVVSTSTRSGGDRDYQAPGEALEERPTVVLINRDTASAAEILAAALQDYELARLVGTRTFGKNTVQEVIGLSAGGALDLTIGEYVTSEGESLADDGVQPDVPARDDPDTPADEGREGGLEELGSLLGG
ncbi:MAG: S41 family peptidase [Solirubrobacterales bacterium]